MRRPKLTRPVRRAAQGVAAAPLIAALALASAMITAIVALGALSAGRLRADGSIGMVCALVLAAVAAVEASRPARVNRVSRRLARSRPEPADADDY